MSLNWSALPPSRLCIVTGADTVTRADIKAYLDSSIEEGIKSYGKLVDITACTLALDADDLETVADDLIRYGAGEPPGPVAMVVASALNLDMAVLLKQRVGDRPFRIFTNAGAARAWLSAAQESQEARALSTVMRTRQRRLRSI